MTSPDLDGAFGVHEAAARIGRYRWTEERLFEVLGGWVASVPELDVKRCLGTQSHHHAWHAELWVGCLPQLGDTTPDQLTAAANDEMVAFMTALAEPDGADQTIERLVGVYRVLVPRTIAAYAYHLDHTRPIADGPVIRTLRIVLQDELDDWREGEALVQSLLVGPEEVRRASERQAALEALMVAAGGIAGRTG